MDYNLEIIIKRIDDTRRELQNMLNTKQIDDAEVIQVSQKLDELLNIYQKMFIKKNERYKG